MSEAAIGQMPLNAMECQGLLATPEAKRQAWDRIALVIKVLIKTQG